MTHDYSYQNRENRSFAKFNKIKTNNRALILFADRSFRLIIVDIDLISYRIYLINRFF